MDQYILDSANSITIAPNWGCNMFSWVMGGKELIFCPPDLPRTAQKITGGGNPILFPSIGRTWDRSSGEPIPGNYRVYGIDKTFYMPSHGVLFMCELTKSDEQAGPDQLKVTYQTRIPQKVQDENYPFDLGFTQSYTLERGSVLLEAEITNYGPVPAPCAFGYHPYFAISNPQREGISVSLPAARKLELTPDTVMLTGESQPTDGEYDLLDGIYYDWAFDEPTGTRMSIIDRRAGHAIHVDSDPKCELFVLYSPGLSDFVCIEPWTRGLGAYEQLKNPGWESGEVIPVIDSKESVKYMARFSVEDIGAVD